MLKFNLLCVILLVCLIFITFVTSQSTLNKNKSEYGQPFDEIVVESSLTVRKKDTSRQGRTMPQRVSASKLIIPEEGKRSKRFAGIPIISL